MPNTYTETSLTTLAALKVYLDPPPQGGLSRVISTATGASYTTAAGTVVDSKGTGATVTPVIVGGHIVDWTITASGRDYVDPTVVVSGDGTGAAAAAVVGSDAVLSGLLRRVSATLVQCLNRTTIFDTGADRTETRNGNGQAEILTKVFPIVSVSAVVIEGQAIPASNGPTAQGFTFDDRAIYLRGYRFIRSAQNITIVYRGGVAQDSQEQATLEQACLTTCVYLWKKRSFLHQVSIAQSGGLGTVTLSQKDVPDDVWMALRPLKDTALYLP